MAALLQVYSPRDPLLEVVRGDISVDQLAVMVEHLPPGSAYHRAVRGTWTQTDELLLAVESRLRDTVSSLALVNAQLRAGFKLTGATSPPTPNYIEPPAPPDWLDDLRDSHQAIDPAIAAARADLDAAMYR